MHSPLVLFGESCILQAWELSSDPLISGVFGSTFRGEKKIQREKNKLKKKKKRNKKSL